MNKETRLKLLAWFAVHAPPEPTPGWHIKPGSVFSHQQYAAAIAGQPSREAWCAEWARRQLVEFEKMWDTLEEGK